MNKFLVLFIILAISCVYSVDKKTEKDFQGLWQGLVIDENDSTNVGLNLYYDNGALTGKFTLLDAPLVDEDIVFDVSTIEISENEIKLVVLTSGMLDQDAFEIQAHLEKNQLVGTIQEMKQGSEPVSVIFRRALTK